MSGPYQELRQAAAAANNRLDDEGLVVHSFGNASEVDRDAGVFAIKPSGLACAAVGADDMVVVSLEDGSVVWSDKRPSADTPTHRIIYRGIETAGGVVHTHSRHATSWAQARTAIPCLGTTHADHFHGPIPVTRPLDQSETQGDYEANTGEVIVEMYQSGELRAEEAPGALVASHGPFAWGDTADTAVSNASAMEVIAEMALYTLSINPEIPALETYLLDRHFTRKHGPMAYYGQP